jgi:stress-induced morphogen
MRADDIRARILAALPDADVRVVDTTGTGDHFAATVVSPTFAATGLIDRHRLVYAALGDALSGGVDGSGAPIHALALTTLTPDEHRRSA